MGREGVAFCHDTPGCQSVIGMQYKFRLLHELISQHTNTMAKTGSSTKVREARRLTQRGGVQKLEGGKALGDTVGAKARTALDKQKGRSIRVTFPDSLPDSRVDTGTVHDGLYKEMYDILSGVDKLELAEYLLQDACCHDDVLDNLRRYLASALASSEPTRKNVGDQILASTQLLHQDLNWQHVWEDVLAWAQGGYREDEPPRKYYDRNGKERARDDSVDPDYGMDMDNEPPTEDSSELPSDMTWANALFDKADKPLEEMLRSKDLDQGESWYASLQAINREITTGMKVRNIEPQLTVQVAELLSDIPRIRLGNNADDYLSLWEERFKRRGQPLRWVATMRELSATIGNEDDRIVVPTATGSYKLNIPPGKVRYENANRRIGAVRQAGKGYVVFLEMFKKGELCLWHMVGAKQCNADVEGFLATIGKERDVRVVHDTKGDFSDIKKVRPNDFDIVGLAYRPLKAYEVYAARPHHLILARVPGSPKMWFDFSTLARRYGHEYIAQICDQIRELGNEPSLEAEIKEKHSSKRTPIAEDREGDARRPRRGAVEDADAKPAQRRHRRHATEETDAKPVVRKHKRLNVKETAKPVQRKHRRHYVEETEDESSNEVDDSDLSTGSESLSESESE